MQFVLTDTKRSAAIEMSAALGRVNRGWLSVGGQRLAPGTALVTWSSWVAGDHPEIHVDRVNCPRTCDLAFIGTVQPSVPPYQRSIEVDRLLMRCEPLRASRTARVLRWLRRIGR